MISLHETCQQYVARRLSEGWKIIHRKGYHLILSSPDGNILRPVDLRNDIETLRPSGAGGVTGLTPSAGANWECVDEDGTGDGDGTTVSITGGASFDRYTYPASGIGAGTINSVTLYIRAKADIEEENVNSRIRTHDTDYYHSIGDILTTSYVLYDHERTVNPNTTDPWTWDEIDALEAGGGISGGAETACITQVYVEVDYTPAGWTGKISGVTNPAKVMGIPVANIAKVKGVA